MPSAFVPTPDCIQAEVRHVVNGQQCEWVLHFDNRAGDFGAAALTLGALIVDNIILPMLPTMGPQVSFNEIYFTDLSTQFSGVLSYTTDLPLVGSGILPSLPNGTALVLCKRTNARGRSRRGRTYISGVINDRVANSQFTPGYVSALLSIWNNFRELAAAEGLPLVVLSKQENGVIRTTGLVTDVTNIVNVTPSTRSQRRRNPGIGI